MNYKPIDFNNKTPVIDQTNEFVKKYFDTDLFIEKKKLTQSSWLQLISVRATYDFYRFEIESKEVKQSKLIILLKFPNTLDEAKREYFIKVMKASGITETIAFKSLLKLYDFPIMHLMNIEIEDIVDSIIDEINPKRISEFSKFISNKLYILFTKEMDPENIKAFVLSYETSSKDAYGFIEDQMLKNIDYNSLDDLQLKIIYQYGLSLIGENSELISIELGLDYQNKNKCLQINKKIKKTINQATKIVPDMPRLRQYRGPKF